MQTLRQTRRDEGRKEGREKVEDARGIRVPPEDCSQWPAPSTALLSVALSQAMDERRRRMAIEGRKDGERENEQERQ